MAEVGQAAPVFHSGLDLAGSFILPGKASKLLGASAAKLTHKPIAKAVAGKTMMPMYTAYDYAKKPFQMAKQVQHASRYGASLGKANPYLTSAW